MFSKEFEYTDYMGNKQKETWWFNLTKAEMMKREMGSYGGLEHVMRKMLKEERPDKVLDLLEEIVLSAVGEISVDGRRFVKTEKIREEFKQTPMFSDLLFDLMTQKDALKAFILGAIPAEISAKLIEDEAKESDEEIPVAGSTNTAAVISALPNGGVKAGEG